MNNLIILFIVSIVGMLFMIILRTIELTMRRSIISEKFRDMTDRKIIFLWNKGNRFIVARKKSFKKFTDSIPVFFARILYIILRWIRRKGDRFFNMIKGKGALTNKGSASFFLNSIHKHKEDSKK